MDMCKQMQHRRRLTGADVMKTKSSGLLFPVVLLACVFIILITTRA